MLAAAVGFGLAAVRVLCNAAWRWLVVWEKLRGPVETLLGITLGFSKDAVQQLH